MKRDYIAELKNQGLSLRAIERETGISHQRLSDYATSKKPLKSSSAQYEKLRNLNRKTSYNKLRKEGVIRTPDNQVKPMTPEMAKRYRRTLSSPETYTSQSTKKVQHTKINADTMQLKMLAEYQHEVTHEKRLVESFSKAHKNARLDPSEITEDYIELMGETDVVDYDETQELVAEAIKDAQGTLGDSNWFLIRIIDVEVITYQIG